MMIRGIRKRDKNNSQEKQNAFFEFWTRAKSDVRKNNLWRLIVQSEPFKNFDENYFDFLFAHSFGVNQSTFSRQKGDYFKITFNSGHVIKQTAHEVNLEEGVLTPQVARMMIAQAAAGGLKNLKFEGTPQEIQMLTEAAQEMKTAYIDANGQVVQPQRFADIDLSLEDNDMDENPVDDPNKWDTSFDDKETLDLNDPLAIKINQTIDILQNFYDENFDPEAGTCGYADEKYDYRASRIDSAITNLTRIRENFSEPQDNLPQSLVDIQNFISYIGTQTLTNSFEEKTLFDGVLIKTQNKQYYNKWHNDKSNDMNGIYTKDEATFDQAVADIRANDKGLDSAETQQIIADVKDNLYSQNGEGKRKVTLGEINDNVNTHLVTTPSQSKENGADDPKVAKTDVIIELEKAINRNEQVKNNHVNDGNSTTSKSIVRLASLTGRIQTIKNRIDADDKDFKLDTTYKITTNLSEKLKEIADQKTILTPEQVSTLRASLAPRHFRTQNLTNTAQEITQKSITDATILKTTNAQQENADDIKTGAENIEPEQVQKTKKYKKLKKD